MTITRGSPLLRARRGVAPPLNPIAIATKGWWTIGGDAVIPVRCPPIFRELAFDPIGAIVLSDRLPVAATYAGNFSAVLGVDIPLLPQASPYLGDSPNLEFVCCEE